MSHPTLKLLITGYLVLALPALARDPHLDPSHVPGGCSSCHRSHGLPGSPQLPAPQVDVCLACHGSQGAADQERIRGNLAPTSEPALLSTQLSRAFTHALTPNAFSWLQEDVVTCTSCHLPHVGDDESQRGPGILNTSTREPGQLEYELCQSCHGSLGARTQNLLDISRLTTPLNRSYHPVEAPASDVSPSVRPELAGKTINCTDCHGNSDPEGPKGPHGSTFEFILVARYDVTDGNAESLEAYSLCYACHDRDEVMSGSRFPYHRLHVDGERTSCATCHNAHGSVDNRALIRIGEETTAVASVSPSMETGRLEYESDVPGSGSCYLMCHGSDHGPKSYGTAKSLYKMDFRGRESEFR